MKITHKMFLYFSKSIMHFAKTLSYIHRYVILWDFCVVENIRAYSNQPLKNIKYFITVNILHKLIPLEEDRMVILQNNCV